MSDEWWLRAACRGADPDLFHPAAARDAARTIRRFCHRCPVIDMCAEFAAEDKNWGVFGGAYWVASDNKHHQRVYSVEELERGVGSRGRPRRERGRGGLG